MVTIELSPAQAAGLLELADRAAESGVPPQGMGGKRFIAAGRAIERLRDAIGRHQPSALDLELDAIADGLDGLHDPDMLARLRTRLRDLARVLDMLNDLEGIRRKALTEGHGSALRRADVVLEMARNEEVHWRSMALDLIASCKDGLPESFGPLNQDVFDLFELDVFELSLRAIRERGLPGRSDRG